MAHAISPFFRDLSCDPFLFAEIGEERNGMLLSVLSALARLDLDPWREAASLSSLPPPAATERLTSLLSSLPSSQLKTPTPATITRLVGLLPRAIRSEVRPRGAEVAAKSTLSWPMVAVLIVAFAIICAGQFAERREPPTGGGASPAASVSDPDAGKARRE